MNLPLWATKPRFGMQPATVVVVAILLLSAVLKLNHLGHSALKGLDESFHAVVAQNLLKHPLTPTLIDQPWLPGDETDWMSSHVWLHKPPLALWTIALSFWCFDVSALTLRLPSLVLTTASAWITYRIGTRVSGRLAGAAAATLQAMNPALLMLVNGYLFSDHVDTALVFWIELGVLALVHSAQAGSAKSRRWWAITSGAAAGCAVLTKSYPGLLVIGIGFGAAIVSRQMQRSGIRFRIDQLTLMIAGAVVVASPYLLFAAIEHPHEFASAELAMLEHLDKGVEGFGAPWDRLWFDYAADAFYVFYVTMLAAVAVPLFRILTPALDTPAESGREGDLDRRSVIDIRNHHHSNPLPDYRERGPIAIMLIWAALVFGTMTITANKTPSATAIGWPAGFLLVGCLISQAWRGDRLALGVCFVASLAATVYPGHFISGGMAGSAGDIMRVQYWIAVELVVTLIGGVLVSFIPLAGTRAFPIITSVLCVWLLFAPRIAGRPPGYAIAAAAVTRLDRETPDLVQIGAFARTLPGNAVLLLKEQSKFQRNALMFYADRTVYPIAAGTSVEEQIGQLSKAGAQPFVVTSERRAGTVLFQPNQGTLLVYRG